MKKMMMVMAIVIMVMMCGCEGNKVHMGYVGPNDGEIYGRLTKVVELNYEEDYVVVRDSHGYEWSFYGCEDWEIDDICILSMKSMGNENIFDDEIISATYSSEFCE